MIGFGSSLDGQSYAVHGDLDQRWPWLWQMRHGYPLPSKMLRTSRGGYAQQRMEKKR